MPFDLFTGKSNSIVFRHLHRANAPVIMPLSHLAMPNRPFGLMVLKGAISIIQWKISIGMGYAQR